MQAQKAPVRLIDAFYEYYKKDKSACFVIIGGGNLKAHKEKHINKLGIEKNVLLLERMGPRLQSNFYMTSDVMLLTRNYEGMPRVVLEALAWGTPILTTDTGEVLLVIKNCFSGEVVEGFDPENIAQALHKVINHPEIYTKENCVQFVEKFTPQRMLGLVYENIRELHQQRFGNVIKTG